MGGGIGLALHCLVLTSAFKDVFKPKAPKEVVDAKLVAAEAKKAADEGGDTGKTDRYFKVVEEARNQAGTNLTGVAREVFEANNAFLKQTQNEVKQFEIAFNRVNEAEIFTPEANNSLEKIAQNRRLVQNYFNANHSLSNA
ncbi:MAG: hypothetical protein K0Q55_2897, partial [Verrucomicrobia bacterium]|nr:hypothetical protein [Verrucomicrobiota bacterium]